MLDALDRMRGYQQAVDHDVAEYEQDDRAHGAADGHGPRDRGLPVIAALVAAPAEHLYLAAALVCEPPVGAMVNGELPPPAALLAASSGLENP